MATKKSAFSEFASLVGPYTECTSKDDIVNVLFDWIIKDDVLEKDINGSYRITGSTARRYLNGESIKVEAAKIITVIDPQKFEQKIRQLSGDNRSSLAAAVKKSGLDKLEANVKNLNRGTVGHFLAQAFADIIRSSASFATQQLNTSNSKSQKNKKRKNSQKRSKISNQNIQSVRIAFEQRFPESNEYLRSFSIYITSKECRKSGEGNFRIPANDWEHIKFHFAKVPLIITDYVYSPQDQYKPVWHPYNLQKPDYIPNDPPTSQDFDKYLQQKGIAKSKLIRINPDSVENGYWAIKQNNRTIPFKINDQKVAAWKPSFIKKSPKPTFFYIAEVTSFATNMSANHVKVYFVYHMLKKIKFGCLYENRSLLGIPSSLFNFDELKSKFKFIDNLNLLERLSRIIK